MMCGGRVGHTLPWCAWYSSLIHTSLLCKTSGVDVLKLSCVPFSFTCSDAFDLQFGVVIFRLRAGFDATERIEEKGNRTTTGCVSNHCYCGTM